MVGYIKINFPQDRTVLVNGTSKGKTNQVFMLPSGEHHIWLDDPRDYTPSSQAVVVEDQGRDNPLNVTFNQSTSSDE
jgi:hypothetical protein